MRFQITKIIGFVGIASFAIWSGLLRLEPVQHKCEVIHYGIPDMSILAHDIIEFQKSSYDTDYNYHRSIEYIKDNSEFCDMIDNIEYYGHRISNGDMTTEMAEHKIEQNLRNQYNRLKIETYDLVLSWNTSRMFCRSILNVSSDMNLVPGDIIDCYESNALISSNNINNANVFECKIELKKAYNFESYIFFFTCVAIVCFALVIIVTLLAMIVRICRTNRTDGSIRKKFGFNSENTDQNIEVRSISPSTSE